MNRKRASRPSLKASARRAGRSGPRGRRSRAATILLLGGTLVILLIFAASFLIDRQSPLWLRLRALIPGQVAKVLVAEGATGFDVARSLEAHGVCSATGFLAAFSDRTTLDALGIALPSAEGYLAPAIYDFLRESRPEKVLARMVRRRAADFAELGPSAPPAPLKSREEALVLASVVEAEARVAEERAKIAAVFLNRLRSPEGETHGRLQSDPSAGYGCRISPPVSAACLEHQRSGRSRVTPALLRDPDNPYNTYRRAGLPPGPISNPGIAALRAVYAPEPTSDLYFVSDGNGGHRFARTFAEHQRNVLELSKLHQQAPDAPREGAPEP